MDTAAIITEKLKQKGWNQSELALKSGVTQAQISRLINGRSGNLTLATLRNLAAAFGCAPIDLMPEEDKRKRAA